jgi:hypothetical protein
VLLHLFAGRCGRIGASMIWRRSFLKRKFVLPLTGGWMARAAVVGAALKRDYFRELGQRQFINECEPFTALASSAGMIHERQG